MSFYQVASKRISKTLTLPGESPEAVPVLIITSVNGSFQKKKLELFEPINIGRQTSAKTVPSESNGFFDNKVLSRVHAQVYAEKGKVPYHLLIHSLIISTLSLALYH